MGECYRYSLSGEVSAKKNENRFNTSTGRVFKSDRFRSWHMNAMYQLLTQEKPRNPISSPVSVKVSFSHGDNRRRDGDNGLSAIMDLLVDARILKDDCWSIVREISVTNGFDKGNPHTEISIEVIE